MNSPSVGIIGLGLVGSAIAQRLLSAGYQVIGFDLNDERNAELQAAGGEPARDAGEVCLGRERVILSLPTSTHVQAVLQPLGAALDGKTIIDTTTGDPDATAETGRMLVAHGAAYLVATIAGSSTQVARGEALVMTGGSEEVAARCDDLLTQFSRERFHVGDWLDAGRMKLVINLVLGLNRAVLAEGLSFAQRCGIDPGRALEVLKAGPTYARVMDTKGARMVTGNFVPEARLAQHAKDVGLIVQLGESLQAELPFSILHRQLLATLIEQGFGDLDNSAIIHAFGRETR